LNLINSISYTDNDGRTVLSKKFYYYRNISLFDVKCVSPICEIFTIKKDNLHGLLKREEGILEAYKSHVSIKRRMYLNIFEKIKVAIINNLNQYIEFGIEALKDSVYPLSLKMKNIRLQIQEKERRMKCSSIKARRNSVVFHANANPHANSNTSNIAISGFIPHTNTSTTSSFIPYNFNYNSSSKGNNHSRTFLFTNFKVEERKLQSINNNNKKPEKPEKKQEIVVNSKKSNANPTIKSTKSIKTIKSPYKSSKFLNVNANLKVSRQKGYFQTTVNTTNIPHSPSPKLKNPNSISTSKMIVKKKSPNKSFKKLTTLNGEICIISEEEYYSKEKERLKNSYLEKYKNITQQSPKNRKIIYKEDENKRGGEEEKEKENTTGLGQVNQSNCFSLLNRIEETKVGNDEKSKKDEINEFSNLQILNNVKQENSFNSNVNYSSKEIKIIEEDKKEKEKESNIGMKDSNLNPLQPQQHIKEEKQDKENINLENITAKQESCLNSNNNYTTEEETAVAMNNTSSKNTYTHKFQNSLYSLYSTSTFNLQRKPKINNGHFTNTNAYSLLLDDSNQTNQTQQSSNQNLNMTTQIPKKKLNFNFNMNYGSSQEINAKNYGNFIINEQTIESVESGSKNKYYLNENLSMKKNKKHTSTETDKKVGVEVEGNNFINFLDCKNQNNKLVVKSKNKENRRNNPNITYNTNNTEYSERLKEKYTSLTSSSKSNNKHKDNKSYFSNLNKNTQMNTTMNSKSKYYFKHHDNYSTKNNNLNLFSNLNSTSCSFYSIRLFSETEENSRNNSLLPNIMNYNQKEKENLRNSRINKNSNSKKKVKITPSSFAGISKNQKNPIKNLKALVSKRKNEEEKYVSEFLKYKLNTESNKNKLLVAMDKRKQIKNEVKWNIVSDNNHMSLNSNSLFSINSNYSINNS